MRRLVVGLGFVLAACGGGGTPFTQPDAGSSTDGGADAPPSFAACAEFSAEPIAVPAHVNGQVGGSDLESPSTCAVVDAPFGIESAGPDRVIALMNLVPNAPYVVKLSSASDLSFYVVTGCGSATGPRADQCQLFQDAAGEGGAEVGTFVAEGSTAYVVVDYYASHAPTSADFTLDVYAQQCEDSGVGQCGGATPACYQGRCVGCVTSFDCQSATASVCSPMQACIAGNDSCTTDGTGEPENDGPAGASMLALDGLGQASAAGKICSSPAGEADFFAFDVTSLGETWLLQLGWTGGRDLDLQVFDATGTALGLSFWEQPERVRLTYLPLGRYYARVREFASTPDASPVTYTLSAQRTLGAGCSSAADCAAEYRNQIFRGSCEAGACVAIDGDGAVAEGGRCDSQSDCASSLSCPSFFFVSGGDTRETCARSCTDDAGCAALGAGHVCTTYFSNNFCVARCTEDAQCPTVIQSAPASGPWRRLTCDVPTGRCVP